MAVTFPSASRPLSTARRAHAVRSASQPHLRLTRRGRIVIVLSTLAVLLVAGFTVGRVSASSAAAGAPRTTVVQAGDTLWSIATKTAPDRDPRGVIAQIERLNHLGSVTLVPGTQLTLPS